MKQIEEHHTPDGLFRFVVEQDDSGDIACGFDGFPWHIHGDMLASLSGASIDAAVRRYVDALLAGDLFIAVAHVPGGIRDVWIVDDRQKDTYKSDAESIEYRYWDGRPAA